MNYCENCGNKLTPEDRFCQNCGTAVSQDGIGPFSPAQNAAPAAAPVPVQPKKKSSGKTLIITGIIILFLIIVAGGGLAGYLFLFKKTSALVEEVKSGKDKPENETVKKDNSSVRQEDDKQKTVTKKEGFVKRERKPGDCGEYPEVSERKLTPEELTGVSAKEKKYMLNEIYMRHGYIFTDEDLLIHFAMFECYKPEHMNVNKYLTETEKHNIKLLK